MASMACDPSKQVLIVENGLLKVLTNGGVRMSTMGLYIPQG